MKPKAVIKSVVDILITMMILHLGLHRNMIFGISRKAAGIKSRSKIRSIVAFIAGYDVSVFLGKDFPSYLLLKSEFVFLDYSEPKFLFYIDYLALMGLCIFFAHYSTKLIRKFKKKTEES